ncbi:MAG: DUF4332 domain-containing protein [Hyphomonadaceae bacterium]|nr:DUF4332 domain-containing protein [Hyphomonadaceae bacterium]
MLLFDVVYAHRASGSHHKIALDSLRRIASPDAEEWRKAFCAHSDVYMKGAKAPDDVFRDSQNHVLHVRDNYWGGALETAEAWYEKLLTMMRAQSWPEAVYAAGVLSHYVCDPMQPLHTAQSESEGSIHRAFEQSVSKSYSKLLARIEETGWPSVTAPRETGWLSKLIRSGAEASVVHYDACIDHYNLDAGVQDPPAGLDPHLIDVMADALARAITSFACVIDNAIAEAAVAVAPPKTNVTLQGYLATLDIPIQWLLRKMEDASERATVEAMYAEYQASGKVVATLSHDDRIVRAAHARDVLNTPLVTLDAQPARKPGTKHGAGLIDVAPSMMAPPIARRIVERAAEKPAPAAVPMAAAPVVETPVVEASPAAAAPSTKKRRTRESPVVDAPAIGAKIAARLEAIGVKTIGDLLDADPAALTAMMAQKWVTQETIADWKAMAQLAIDVGAVGEQDAQILIGAGIRDKEALAGKDARALQDQVAAFIASDEGKRLMRGNGGPKPEKVEGWIEAAKKTA